MLRPFTRLIRVPDPTPNLKMVANDVSQSESDAPLNRRRIVLGLNGLTIAVLAAAMAWLFHQGGWTPIKGAMWLTYVVTLPWLSIGFWNALIGFAILKFSNDPLASVSPQLASVNPAQSITTRTAICMAVRNEDPGAAIKRLRIMYDDLEQAGLLDQFDFHVLSDTDDSQIAAREERLIHLWQIQMGAHRKIHYRRRSSNEGYKAGNIDEFCERCAGQYDFFLPLDADSFMSAAAIAQLVRAMQSNPEIGILQGLVVGTPSESFFTRTFQFGMRHGMRAFTMGSAWWQADCGPYWGHNALIRLEPFRKHCKLPVLSGKGPLSGYILSHDQVEAVLMRRAGYQVRVFAMEGESWEDNPPSLPDFIRRELRWCQGNMQYWRLLNLPDIPPVCRIQLALAILMYLSPVAWMAFILLGTLQVTLPNEFTMPANNVGVVLFMTILTMCLMPKLMGLASTITRTSESQRYGGGARALAGGIVEVVFSALAAPVVGFAIAVFAVGLLFGRKLEWQTQQRETHRVTWSEAVYSFWPQTLVGAIMAILLATYAPNVLPWAIPVLAGFVLSVPFTVFTSSRWASQLSLRTGVCDIPEDRNPPQSLRKLMGVQTNVTALTETPEIRHAS